MKVEYCEFCNMRSDLLCDGKLPDGKTCDKKICRRCAHMVAHLKMTKGCNSRDLCPDCVKAGRTVW